MPEYPNDAPWREEMEKDPRFQNYYTYGLGIIILHKKFGEQFFDEHERLAIHQAFENEHGYVSLPQDLDEFVKKIKERKDLIPEVGEFRKKVEAITNPTDMLQFAQNEHIEITPEDIAEAKNMALEGLIDDDQQTNI